MVDLVTSRIQSMADNRSASFHMFRRTCPPVAKRALRLLLVLMLSLSLICSSSACRHGTSSGQTVLRIGYVAPAGHPVNQAVAELCQEVTARTSRRIQFAVYSSGEPYDQMSLIHACVSGDLDAVLPLPSQLEMYSRKFAVAQLPYAFKSKDQAFRILNGPFKEWVDQDLQAYGLTYLAAFDWGYNHILNRLHTVRTPDDFRGMRIATTHNVYAQKVLANFGAKPIPVPLDAFGDESLEPWVDGYDKTLLEFQELHLVQVDSHITLTGHALNALPFLMNTRSMEQLAETDRRILSDAVMGFSARSRRLNDEATKDALEQLKKQGAEVISVDQSLFKASLINQMQMVDDYIGLSNIRDFKGMLDSIK